MGDYVLQSGDSSFGVSPQTHSVAIYNLTADIVRMTKNNTALGTAETPVVIVSSMPCSIEWKIGSEKISADKYTQYTYGILHCRKPTGVTVLGSDRILYSGKYYRITGVEDIKNLGVLLNITIRRTD